MPKTSIWYDLERFGLNGAAAVLEARIRDHGGNAVVETLADRAARLKRAQHFMEEKEAFHGSEQGVKASREAYKRFVDDLKANTELLTTIGARVRSTRDGITTLVVGAGVVLTTQYQPFYANTLDSAVLEARFYDQVPPLSGIVSLDGDPHQLESYDFTFQLVGPDRAAWVDEDGEEYSIEGLAEYVIRRFMDLHQAQSHG
jgi:hypothetical protein